MWEHGVYGLCCSAPSCGCRMSKAVGQEEVGECATPELGAKHRWQQWTAVLGIVLPWSDHARMYCTGRQIMTMLGGDRCRAAHMNEVEGGGSTGRNSTRAGGRRGRGRCGTSRETWEEEGYRGRGGEGGEGRSWISGVEVQTTAEQVHGGDGPRLWVAERHQKQRHHLDGGLAGDGRTCSSRCSTSSGGRRRRR